MSRKIIKSKYFFEEDYIEKIGEVSTEKVEDWKNNETLKYVGKPISRVDGYDKVSGSAVFTFDVKLPRMIYARILGSTHPNAMIKKIDTAAAEKLKGVLKVYTHENMPKIKWYRESTLLLDNHVRCEGDEVAVVVAETERIAEAAIKMIEVEYEELPFVTTSLDALKQDAVKVHEFGNLLGGKPYEYSRGNVEEGFKQADIIFEDEFSTQVVVHNPTELFCSVVNWDGDMLTVYDSTQGVFAVRSTVAQSLDIPESKVRVITKYMGGGFGAKLEAGKYSVIAAVAAKELGRPVNIVMNRAQTNLIMGNRPDSIQKFKAGIKKDGTLTAFTLASTASVGAYPAGGGVAGPFRSVYHCPNLSSSESSVLINAGRARAFRAPGHVQGTFAMESFVDELAEKAGMDPLEFRLKNYAELDPLSGKPYSTKLLKEAYKKGAEKFGWKSKWKKPGSDKGHIKRGIGLATQIWWGSGGPPAYCVLKLNRDGSVNIVAGSQDIGTGTYTFVSQVAAEVLEIPMNKIQVTLGDTAVIPFGPSSGGSTTAPSISPAVRDAAEQMKAKLISAAAAVLSLPEEQLKYEKATVSDKTGKSKALSVKDIMKKMDEDVLITTGARNANPEEYAINTFGVQFAEVEVNTETGKVKVLKIVAAHDIGRVLNKKTLENQLHGGIIQGMGYALMEERLLDKNTGKVLNPNFHSYKVAAIKDMPQIEVVIVSEGDKLISNTGVKGVGEPAIIPTAGAIANAVYNAIGVRVKSLPITPDKVLDALYS